ncbi:Uncharacterised protein [Providencia alcalifaciens]|nr:Uncharacterised protein [Providencia alcalifaciens]
MSEKVILVVLDGLSYSVAHQCMGYLNGLIKADSATLYKMECELPSMSRPLYECILTGIAPRSKWHRQQRCGATFSLREHLFTGSPSR